MMAMDEQKREQGGTGPEKIDLLRILEEFWKILVRFLWVPILLGILGAAAMGARAYLNYTPRYRSEATFTIQSVGSSYDLAGTGNYYDKLAAEQLAITFPFLLQSDLMQSMLMQELGVTWLNGSISAQAVPDTNLFLLQVTSSSAEDAYQILDTIIQIYPRVADYVVGSTNIEMLSPPELAEAPYNQRNVVRPAVKGGILGVGAGLAILLCISLTRKTVRTREDVKKRLNAHCLGAIPTLSFKRRTGHIDRTVSILNSKASSSFQESVRSLRIRFLREAEKRQAKVVVVSSTLPGEGRTTVAANLALSLSQNGSSVILVDLDLRNPSIKERLGVTAPSKGVAELLESRQGDPADYLIPVEGTRVRLLAGDKAASDPKRQMESRRLAAIVGALRDEADFVILDTPPSGLLGDSAAVAALSDGILYVIRAGVAQVWHIMDSIQFLSNSRTALMGCVLNGAKASAGSYGYDGYHRYGRYGSKTEQREG